jgi:hypothetical protein
MALKKLIDVGEAFPIKKPRLGAAPPPADTLDNVGEQEAAPIRHAPQTVLTTPHQAPEMGARAAAPPVRQHTQGRYGRGVHTGKGIDARRQVKTGRTYQFGARTTVAFADEVKRLAADRGITIGELLEEMLEGYRNVK